MGHKELSIREALAGRKRDQVLISVKFATLRHAAQGWGRIRLTRRSRQSLQQTDSQVRVNAPLWKSRTA
jgi:aryl-alcohol dehydrogenase-like predicted oxidoreductase